MSELKDRLQADLTNAMRSGDKVATATLRMTLTAITNEEVSGKQARELNDDEVLKVILKESKKRRETAEVFQGAGRSDLAEREVEEAVVLDAYLPAQLTDAELTDLVRAAIAEVGATGQHQMGAVMKAVQPRVSGRADGKRVSDEVKAQLVG
jgi:uncharacterized protein YqeY